MNTHLLDIEITSCDLPSTRRGQQRRLALLISANTLFLDHGYDAVSLDDIVQHAGGSKASIYKYFGNKEGLFVAICDYRRDMMFKDICPAFSAESEHLREYLITTLYNFYLHLLNPENAAFIRLIVERTQANPEFALYIHEQGPKHIHTSIAEILTKAHQEGSLDCPQPMFSAQLYIGIVRQLEWQTIMGININTQADEIKTYFSYCIDRFLAGHRKN